MKTILFFALFTLGFASSAFTNESALVEILECYVLSVEDDKTIPNDRAVVRVQVLNNGFQKGEVIQYGYGDLSLEAALNDQLSFEFSMDSGIVEFQFYPKARTEFAEITSNPLHIKGGAITTLVIRFLSPHIILESVKKPVIYLYPTEEEVVSVTLKTPGELTFTYPIYENGWTFTARPSGELLFGEERYNYLFWEAEMEVASSDWMEEGKIVGREELMAYLESVLEQFHFTSKEKADFITFWAPQLQRHNQTFVRFVYNEACDQFAELSITPTPDQLIRLYIIWTPIDPDLDAKKYELQQFPELPTREGFTVLEWGGIER